VVSAQSREGHPPDLRGQDEAAGHGCCRCRKARWPLGCGLSGAERGGYSGRGPAASGSFGGEARQAGNYDRGGAAGWQRDRNAVAQQQHERMSGLRGPEQGRQDGLADRQGDREGQRQENLDQRQQQRDQAREDRQKHGNNRREDWQDYADDHQGYYDSDHYDGYGYAGAAAAVAAGAAIGAAAATPPYWTLPCTPTTVVVGATTYYQCGSSWYIQAYSAGDVAYTMVNPPAGY